MTLKHSRILYFQFARIFRGLKIDSVLNVLHWRKEMPCLGRVEPSLRSRNSRESVNQRCRGVNLLLFGLNIHI